jgi:hypothetical protein
VKSIEALTTFLGFDRQGRDRPRIKAFDRDRLTGLFAVAVGAVVDAPERGVDLGDQLALTVTCSQFDGQLGFR